ncbi:DUF262 domain-containing protein [Rhizobacter sp. Root1221]|uniref:DUF262 domain-containing protein n=1 Tax=Rhizobacter sp. Root1221 TaxID=1736433 RepID=UPI0007017D45|nr:DUF262 domain-containing protein [Rhizobacter sp. Root1221]KQV84556.1 hypothetical protein ASC87_29865 [Rhizobacter sp. Root1221]
MSLIEQINKKRREIKTDGYPMSIGEWVSMYEREELDIHPEFQRFYRWTTAQKAGLIESILLGIPLPPIFVSQRDDGVWDVVDGLQRLSTIFQFMGLLRDDAGKRMEPLTLEGTKYLPGLRGIRWDIEGDPKKSMPKELQLVMKRSKIAASIVLKESDESAKYDLFQRLNTGGSELSPQEVRNCLLLMVNKSFFEWLKDLPRFDPFIEATALSDRPLEEAYDVELALRFVLLAQIPEEDIRSIGDVGAFLTDRMSDVAQDKKFRRAGAKQLFEDTFSVLNDALEDASFKRYNAKKKKHEGGFLLSMFEVVALGVAYNLAHNTLCSKGELVKRARSVWGSSAFTDWATSGVTASRRLPRLIPLGRKLFAA